MNLYDIAKCLSRLLYNNNLKIVTAESCTGGMIAQALTSVPGSSIWFEQGWITYSNESKIRELNVPMNLLTEYGAVSEEVVRAMAVGALANSTSNISLATSGVAGPDGGTVKSPVGTVWTAIAFDNLNHLSSIHDVITGNTVFTQCYHFDGSRESIREQTVAMLLNKVIDHLNL